MQLLEVSESNRDGAIKNESPNWIDRTEVNPALEFPGQSRPRCGRTGRGRPVRHLRTVPCG
eukprot:3923647-Pyramimonas_sp.AAC.1